MVAPLGVVVVRDHRHRRETGHGQQVEAFEPVEVLAHLVDLVDGHRGGAEGEGGGAGKRHAPASFELVCEHAGDRGSGPLAQGVGRAAGAGEDEAGGAQPDQRALADQGGGLVGRAPARHLHVEADALGEVLHHPLGQHGDVGLEAEGGVEHHCGDRAWAQALDQLAMGGHHGRAGFS
ncbi:MAG: hypothetical protein ACR2G7_13810 [Acidimicrobiales bacterium]